MDGSFRLFVEECDNFQVCPLSFAWWVASCMTDPDSRVFNFSPIIPLLDPSRMPYSLPSGMSFQNTPL
jgi:hypothetical protein